MKKDHCKFCDEIITENNVVFGYYKDNVTGLLADHCCEKCATRIEEQDELEGYYELQFDSPY